MSMNYIDLTLKKKTTQGGVQQIKECFLANIIDSTNNILVILGSAGSGKTSILKKFFDENVDVAEFFTVKKFLKLDIKIFDSTKILLLDGLDEYRSVEHDKTFVTEALANKLDEINQDIKVVISCREMDWYGNDTKSLKNTLGKNVDLYQILPLNYGQKIALSKLFKVVNPENFIEKCGQYGFLENPQMLKMLVKTCNVSSKVITTKSGLYKKFINHSLESNEEYTRNESNLIDESDIYKYAGYIAFYAIFCNVDKFDEAFIDEIVDSQKGYSRDKIQKTLFTKLFNEKNFAHRTIAEFLLAQFIFNEKFSTDIMKHRIKSLFLSNGQVPTELKGTFSWLCSLSSDLEIIKIDPYYQYCHGDNSMFDDRLKENIILEIKTLSNDNPYFMNGGKSQDFYNSNLDDFLIQELNKNLKSKNHYFLFLLQVIDTEKISNIMQSFLKELTENSSISSYVFSKIVKWLDDKKFLKNTLDKIKDGEIPDEENRIKESILKALYPKDMTHEEVTPYLLCYQQENYIGNYSFLYKTDYKNKKILLEKLHKEGKLNESLRYFFYDYFAETMSKFENE
ncbi:hypothetical protein [uncultured Gammaproteobacteria bacterium]|nr:hypothetical protein [uncultured Gammaproteobacteria bacterium]